MINSVVPEFALENNTWYYVIRKGYFSYNSNLDKIMFESKERCKNAAENRMEKFILANFPDKEDNIHCPLFCY